MNTNSDAKIFEDVKINVKIKLAALWVALMFLYVYADILGFYAAGHIEEVMAGEIAGIQITSTFLLGSAILMAIPSAMIFLSLALQARVNRWTNVIVGTIHAGILGATLFAGRISAYYAFYVIAEAVLIVLIVWQAWTWPKKDD